MTAQKQEDSEENSNDPDVFDLELDELFEALEEEAPQWGEIQVNFTRAQENFVAELLDCATIHAISKKIPGPKF